MRTLSLALFTVVVALPVHAAQEPDFEPIRFGDPDELAYDVPFFGDATYDAAITTPDAVLGQRHGTRLGHHTEIVECFERWDAESPRARLVRHGTTYEGRELVHCIVTSPANHARLDAITGALGRLRDPRGLGDDDAERIVRESPAVAWLGYSIHGDELSGSDAAVALGYHLIASTDADVADLLDDVVVVIDPVMNPDGRERIVSMIEQSFGYVTNLDYASMHRGRWPYGRGNHYLFDLNRDWMAGVHPETRARWSVVLRYRPQLFVDAHEMGGLDTYLFYPQSPAHNPHLPDTLDSWQNVFAADQGAAFDERGWAYYTREWADAWAPFYSDAWGSLNGAVGILYEQASTDGQPLRRASGVVMTYRESVHHHAVSSLANLRTLRANREAILRDYLADARRNVSAEAGGRTFVLVPGRNSDRERELADTLLAQGVEIWRAKGSFTGRAVVTTLLEHADERSFPAGTLLVPARQPQGALVRSFLQLDPRMDEAFLLDEREELERAGSSKIYDVTAWSLPQAYDVDGAWCDDPQVERERVTSIERPDGAVVPDPNGATPVAWAVDGDDDAAVRFAAHALDLALAVHVVDEPFTTAGRLFARGTLLVRVGENGPGAGERVALAARSSGATAYASASGRSPDAGPDLGGQHFTLLRRPRIALLSNAPFSSSEYGHLWHHLDARLRVPFSTLDAQSFGSYDLRRYNVIVLPPGGASFVRDHAERLAEWVEAGGTLVACESSAAAVADEELGLSDVRLRRDELEELDAWRADARRELAARDVSIDLAELWDGESAAPAAEQEGADAEEGDDADGEDGKDEEDDADDDDDDEIDEREDEWMRRFSPQGVILRGLVDDRAWLTAGCGAQLPVFLDGSRVLLSREPVTTAVRLAEADELRLGGLLWPEARERLALGAYATVESRGAGQVVLFASNPAFRGTFLGTARLFSNAVVLGPGAGASQPIDW